MENNANIGREGRLLGVDYGERRTGIAISDETRTIAFPRKTLECPCVAEIVVGWPLNMDGSGGPPTERTQQFMDEVANAICWTTTTVSSAMP